MQQRETLVENEKKNIKLSYQLLIFLMCEFIETLKSFLKTCNT